MKQLLGVILLLSATVALAQRNQRIREEFTQKTKIENPFELRDPFKPPILKNQRKEGRAQRSLMRDGIYTNINPMGVIDIDTLQVVGVMIGKERRALVRTGGDKSQIMVLKEGMVLGKDNAELKAIHPGGIILVEKLTNVYGEDEYLETVIPISQ